ncbi:uncharacterized protein LOC111701635 [Eurytemora carolleeae]|uniref:uncharacterized protein LOC111701635 n=1 Tax=Eurytemora carolleeae TaxID=1294199 RepID=UPI000C766257|nr:uncharacterized protein LOC111701635 [Eurytemora carolleeae]|eukprot:XP_023328778.1 uncharacterized protein LOC111701635 [Eurytemora affinis]
MMAGEYNFDYNFTFQSVRDVGGSNGVVQILLLAFILLVSVTIANLIIAIVIANISKFMEEADYYQLEKTVDLLSTVHNIKQTIIRIFPSSKQIFAPTLHDYVGQKTHLCVKITETNPSLSMLVRIQNSFRSASSRFYPVYTYDTNYREAGPQTDLVLPEKILSAALEICREREKEHFSFPGYSDYSSDWRDLIGDMSFPSLDSSILPIPR